MKPLISEECAKLLSQKIFPLGEQVEDLCQEFDKSGYGDPARISRKDIEELAGDDHGVKQLWLYWSEYAKERLAGLAGPIDSLKGRLPATAAYRSAFLDSLRADALAGKLPSGGLISSPQIEPTIKRHSEMLHDQPRPVSVRKSIELARQKAVERKGLKQTSELEHLDVPERYERLLERYSGVLSASGFSMDRQRQKGAVFRKTTSNGAWSFIVVDDSQGDIEFGSLDVTFGLAIPGRRVTPRLLPITAIATWSPEVVVPEFRYVLWFNPSSLAELSLAADALGHLAKLVYERVDLLLADIQPF